MAKAIMIQGTMSNAGKSLFAAALCRIFMQDGYKAAPFKSQNMALNSFITRDGLEIGRAQAMQAEAAGKEPSVLMNPILLKPTTDVGSQVIVNGEVVGNMKASEYFSRKKEFIPDIVSAYERLSAENDIIVIEGAGSPVELNLKRDDIVNMGMARLANAPVLLVGDIDRGGVFAQLLGTLMLLEQEEKAMVKGLVVNKFRGDRSLFDDGVKMLEDKGKVPVVGVVPYIKADIDDEDSLSDKLTVDARSIIDIAVIRFPHLSNFTDFDVFTQYDGASVRYVSKPDELEAPDFLILPGTKSTISDMKWLRESGLEAAVKRLASVGTPLFAICGGYQMLGDAISDPENTECGGEIRGMGLVKAKTVFRAQKTRTQTSGKLGNISGIFSGLSGVRYSGYEIHMGITETDEKSLTETDGVQKDNVYGSYVHGLFDSTEVSEEIIKALYLRKNLTYGGAAISRAEYKQQQYDILADEVRKNVDMKLIYDIIEKGV